ncbi:MAG: Eco29kI family restriction endonuclease [Amylibacter sp.]|nr:Eco29kI family restriction endonuclease [Amylibacter sp.]
MVQHEFDREKHVYANEAFSELVKDALRFFHGTPVHTMPPPTRFEGSGVYALYYTGKNDAYAELYKANRTSYDLPIYIGKAVPKGWRQAKPSIAKSNTGNELFLRIIEHFRNLQKGDGLNPNDFNCRFTIFEDAGVDMISTVESSLIKLHRPVWNTAVDGFGNHDPGAGRYNQAKSDWDVIHPGRAFADKCKGKANLIEHVKTNIQKHFGA